MFGNSATELSVNINSFKFINLSICGISFKLGLSSNINVVKNVKLFISSGIFLIFLLPTILIFK